MPGAGADIFFYTVAAIMVVLVAWFFLSDQDDKLRWYKVAFLAACVMAAVILTMFLLSYLPWYLKDRKANKAALAAPPEE